MLVTSLSPPNLNNQPYAEKYGSIEAELIARASHDHALFREDNQEVYYKLEEATRGTTYAASIKPFQQSKDGRGAWLALVSQYAGVDKWETELKKQEKVIHTRPWKGQSNYSLEKFVSMHRNAFISMQQCAQHVSYQLPNDHSRVGYLLDNIQCNDAGLQAAMAGIRADNDPNNPYSKRYNFEAAVAYMLPYCPVAKKLQTGEKQEYANISLVDSYNANPTNSFGSKKTIGKTGVHLHYHNKSEYASLTKAQKQELREWRDTERNRGKEFPKKGAQLATGNKYANKKARKAMVSTVQQQVKKQLDEVANQLSQQHTTEQNLPSGNPLVAAL